MKKLAIIGTSNAVRRDGYAAILKSRLQDECDVYAIGSCTSTLGVMILLKHNISGKYKYVILDFNINETDCLAEQSINVPVLAANWLYIIKSLSEHGTLPVILMLPYRCIPRHIGSSWLQRSLAQIFDIGIIDIETHMLFYDANKYASDNAHSTSSIQCYIADKCIDFINSFHKSVKNLDYINTIHFTLLPIPGNITPPPPPDYKGNFTSQVTNLPCFMCQWFYKHS